MSLADELIGKTFGRLRITGVIHDTESKRRLSTYTCDCGKTGTVKPTDLLRSKRGVSSCGCLRQEATSARRSSNLVGQRFTRLLVESKGSMKALGKRKILNNTWNCLCDCGNRVNVTSNALLSGNTNSCGCYARDKTSEAKRSTGKGLKTVLSGMRQKAAHRGIAWDIAVDFALSTITSNCYYCGVEPSGGLYGLTYHGLDRVDSNLPYTKDNVVACCKTCNFAKSTLSIEEFKQWLERAYNHLIKKDS